MKQKYYYLINVEVVNDIMEVIEKDSDVIFTDNIGLRVSDLVRGFKDRTYNGCVLVVTKLQKLNEYGD